MNMKSAFFKISIFSFVIFPIILIASPGPGNGCLKRMDLGNDNCKPSLLTSSLNKALRGSTKARFIFLGKPPTL